MKKSVIFLSFFLCATLLIGNVAFGIEEECVKGDDGQPAGISDNSFKIGSSRGPGSLTTLFDGGNGYAGNMVDIIPTYDMSIEAIDVNIDAVGEVALIDVYWKDGTAVGFETSSADWTLLGNFSGTGAGAGLPTWIDMSGNGKTFLAGQTYGIYVHLQNYATITGNMNYTNGSPTVYSNPDLTLTTWCGTTDPAFNSFFADRMWNGTIYYYFDSMAVDPRAVVWVNGGRDPVKLFDFENVKVDIQVDAFSGVGVDHDVWIFILPPFPYSIFSYTPSGWVLGLAPYSSGPLADININILDMQLFGGGWLPVCALDDVPDGIPNTNDIVDMAYLPVKVEPFNPVAMNEDFDDGVADDWIDDGNWSVPVDTYYLDCPSYARFVSYYDGSAYTDFTYTADMLQVDTGNASMTYDFGMFFRSDGTLDNGYDFYAEPDGTVNLYVRVGGSGSLLYTNSLSPYWNIGHDVWNTVSIDVRGSTIDIYINGNLEASVTDTTYTWGYIGLDGQGSGSYDQDFEFDNVSVIL